MPVSYDNLAALTVFAFVMSVTPGPSNLMLLASGVNFGFQRTIPQILGITIGFTSLLLVVGLGLGAMITALPMLSVGMKVVSGAYLLYLSWRIAMARVAGQAGNAHGRPLTFFEAAAFQWVNPKAWMAAVAAMATYGNVEAPFISMIVICLCFAIINLPAVSIWAGFGLMLRGLLTDPILAKWFNGAMALLLAATLWPVIWSR